MKYAIFTTAGIFYCDYAPPDRYFTSGEATWPSGVATPFYMRHRDSNLGGMMRLRTSQIVGCVDLDERVRPDLPDYAVWPVGPESGPPEPDLD